MWTVPLIVLMYVFVLLCEVISGVLFAVDHLTASFTLNSFLCNALADPVTHDWLQLLALQVLKFNRECRILSFVVRVPLPVACTHVTLMVCK